MGEREVGAGAQGGGAAQERQEARDRDGRRDAPAGSVENGMGAGGWDPKRLQRCLGLPVQGKAGEIQRNLPFQARCIGCEA